MAVFSSLVIGLIILYFFLCVFLYIFQEQILFHGQSLDLDYQYIFNFNFQERNYTMSDGANINCLFIPSEASKGVILYFHGNSGNLQRWGKIGHFFTQYGYDVLICDYRGYGKSTGKRSMSTLFSDAESLYNSLLEDYKENQIIIYGRSIGTGIASWLASVTNPSRLILETPFYSVNDINIFRYLLLPVSIISNYPFQNFKFLKQVSFPISILHGTNDRVVPYSSGRNLYCSCEKTHQIDFTTIEKGSHNNLVDFDDYKHKIKGLLNPAIDV